MEIDTGRRLDVNIQFIRVVNLVLYCFCFEEQIVKNNSYKSKITVLQS